MGEWPKCPACGTEMRKNKHDGYECPNEKCEAIFIDGNVKKNIFGVK